MILLAINNSLSDVNPKEKDEPSDIGAGVANCPPLPKTPPGLLVGNTTGTGVRLGPAVGSIEGSVPAIVAVAGPGVAVGPGVGVGVLGNA